MVYQTFRPVPMCRRLGSAPFGQILLLPVCALMLPEIDAFISYFAGDQPDAYLRTGNFHLTIHPVMLDLIQIIYLPAIHSLNDMALETLLALPNLKTIMTHIGQKETNISHGGRRPLTLDYNLSSDLGYWHMKYTGRNFDSIWSRFQEKGIKLYGMIGFWERDPSKCIMEIFPSEDGTMIQYVNPNCSCCPRPLTSERRKLRSEMMEELMEELGYWSL
ncbi:hypothetical protein K4K59_003288 [Colletotrichum sp. SAR11_240]|nr:hypothetical protein K4K59_003288 [Colletotrichum sp. SAR11_240]